MRASRLASRARRVGRGSRSRRAAPAAAERAARLLGTLGDLRAHARPPAPPSRAGGRGRARLPGASSPPPARGRRPARSGALARPASRRRRGRLGRHGGDGAHARLVAEGPDAVEVLVRVDAGGRALCGGRGVVGRSGRDAEDGRQAEAQGQHDRAGCHERRLSGRGLERRPARPTETLAVPARRESREKAGLLARLTRFECTHERHRQPLPLRRVLALLPGLPAPRLRPPGPGPRGLPPQGPRGLDPRGRGLERRLGDPRRSSSTWPSSSTCGGTSRSTRGSWPCPASTPCSPPARRALEFLAGYVVEYSLSIDNIFVFVVVLTYFGVPAAYQHRVLFFGILGALVFRGIFIALGAALLQFEWVVWLFGAVPRLHGREDDGRRGRPGRAARALGHPAVPQALPGDRRTSTARASSSGRTGGSTRPRSSSASSSSR